ncbi:MAG: CoA transferase [Dehalococcoidia bacterium]|nr:CoA transferase [Dehalococcoidia bacterium]
MVLTQSSETAMPRPLDGIRVVDFTWVRAGPWAARWLGALGAQVIKVEWPENPDPLRRGLNDTPPGVEHTLNTSGNFNDTNANKLSVTLNVRTPKGLDLIKRLISVSDVVIENFSSRTLENWGIGYEEMRKLRPDIVYVSQAGFGHTGRHHQYTTAGPIAQAFSGMTYLSGLPGKLPAGWGWSYLDDTGGMYIAFSTLTALYRRNVTGQGQHVDLSQMIIGATLNGPAFLDITANKRSIRREGYPPGNRAHWPGTPLLSNYRGPTVAPHNSYRTKGDGYNDWCVIVCNSNTEWHRLVEVMGSPGWATAPQYVTLEGRLQHQEELDKSIEKWTLSLEKYELMERCQSAGVRSMPVQSNENRVEHDPQLRHRNMFQALEHPVLGLRNFQNAPFKLSESPAINTLPAPLIGEHNQLELEGILGISHEELVNGFEDETFWPKSLDRYPYMDEMMQSGPIGNDADHLLLRGKNDSFSSAQSPETPTEVGPLSGLRVLELADEKGQWCGKLMADLGADVIKIEPPGGEATRGVGPFLDDLPHRERSLSFWHYNTSKRGITLDLETEDGRQLFRQMAAKADIILETFNPGYMASLDLAYDDLKELNPRLIVCSLTPFGQTGPWKDYLGTDLLHLAAGGQMGCCGYDEDDVPNAPPIAGGGGQAWHMGSHYAYMAIMAALVYRTTTGKGQYIDTSVHDACALTTEMHVMVWIYTDKVPLRQTGRHASATSSAKSQLPTKDGKLVNANVAGFRLTPKQMQALVDWMDGYGLADDLKDERYRDQGVIQENASHINEVAAHFFTQLTQEEVAYGGQERGFNWGAVRSPDDLVDDGHLHDRGFWVNVEHPELGRRFTYPGPAGIWNGSPWNISRRAPLIGEHNEEVLCGELGLTKAEMAVLAESGVV